MKRLIEFDAVVVLLCIGVGVLAYQLFDQRPSPLDFTVTAIWNVLLGILSTSLFATIVILFLKYGNQIAAKDARDFWGVGHQNQIHLYLSLHEDKDTATNWVLTREEYEAAVSLRDMLLGITDDENRILSGLVGWQPLSIRVPIKALRSDSQTTEEHSPHDASLVFIGGPIRNKLANEYIKRYEPFVRFNPNCGVFEERVGNKQFRAVQNSGQTAVVERTTVDGQVIIQAQGFGEVHTKLAVDDLIMNWKRYNRMYPNQPFAVRLLRNDDGTIRERYFYPPSPLTHTTK